jgi:hypothetical protein
MYDFDPDSTNPTDVAWVDMSGYSTFLVGVMRSVGTGTIAAFTILANPNSDGSGTDVEIKAHALGSAPDAVGDTIWLECSAEEVTGAGATLRYVSANLDLATSTDECVVYYERCEPKFAYLNLTADVIA